MGLLLLVLLLGVASAKQIDGKWEVLSEAGAHETVGFYLSLRHEPAKLAAFNTKFESITNPKSADYGKWMTPSQVLDMIAPPAADSAAVMAWVRSVCPFGLRKADNRRDTIRVEASVTCVRRLFPNIRLAKFKHTMRRAHVIRLHPKSPFPAVPKHLRSIVDLVIGLDMLPVVRKKKVRSLAETAATATPGVSMDFVYPGDINRVYNIQSNKIRTGSKATQSVIEFYPEGAPLWSDLQLFDQWSQIPFTNFSQIVGPFSPGNDGESLLDIQLISAVAQTPTAYITIPDGWVFSMAQELFTMVNPPLVNSVSYGWPEALTCQSDVTNSHCNAAQDPKAYVAKAELEMQKASSIGLSFSICSQDEGAPSEQNVACQLDNSTTPVWPIYPGCSAFATSVSATTLITNNNERRSSAALPPICSMGYQCSTGSTELPCTVNNTYYGWTTGGGISNYISRPYWQDATVKKYLSQKVPFPPTGTFVPSNRLYPDVSAFGSRILVVSGGSISVSAGTSASTPIIAGIMTLINEARFLAGKTQIGFFNPALYTMYEECPQCFNRIASGNNRCTEGSCCEYGYFVVPGAEGNGVTNAVTGLGTFNVAKVIEYMVKL